MKNIIRLELSLVPKSMMLSKEELGRLENDTQISTVVS